MSSRSKYIVANVKRKTAAVGRTLPAKTAYRPGAPSVRKQIADKIRRSRGTK